MKLKYLIMAAAVGLMTSACGNDDEPMADQDYLTVTTQYDIKVPEGVLPWANVYAIYNDSKGERHKELMPDGTFRRTFNYEWHGKDQVSLSQPDFGDFKVVWELKVPAETLPGDYELFGDPDAHCYFKINTEYRKVGKDGLGETIKKEAEKNFEHDERWDGIRYNKDTMIDIFTKQAVDVPFFHFYLGRESGEVDWTFTVWSF